jgi:hypothetical protein
VVSIVIIDLFWSGDGFICCTNIPGRILGTAEIEEDELFRRSETKFCQKAGLDEEVEKGSGGAPISDPDLQLL